MSAEHKMATLLADEMFTDCNSSPLRQHIVNQTFFVFYRIQQVLPRCHSLYCYHNLLFFVNNGFQFPLPSLLMYLCTGAALM